MKNLQDPGLKSPGNHTCVYFSPDIVMNFNHCSPGPVTKGANNLTQGRGYRGIREIMGWSSAGTNVSSPCTGLGTCGPSPPSVSIKRHKTQCRRRCPLTRTRSRDHMARDRIYKLERVGSFSSLYPIIYPIFETS